LYASAAANSCSVRPLTVGSSVAGCSPAAVLRRVAKKPTTTNGTTTTAKTIHGITRGAYPAARNESGSGRSEELDRVAEADPAPLRYRHVDAARQWLPRLRV